MELHQLKTIEAYDKSAVNYAETHTKLINYNHTYDYLVANIPENAAVLDLACGPANISQYLLERKKVKVIGFDLSEEMLKIARESIPDGDFKKQSIIDFTLEEPVNLVINGFGIPYLNNDQIAVSFKSSGKILKQKGLIYLSFMDGESSGYEKVSFGRDEQFYIYYHRKEAIRDKLEQTGFKVVKEWVLDYQEPDGRITKDIVLVGERL